MVSSGPVYSGPYTFSGNNKTITEDFYVTASKLTVEYSASGIGDFPDIYTLTVWLYDENRRYVDAVVGLEGSGTFNFRTNGAGFYYLEVVPLYAGWTFTVSQ